MSSVTIPTTQDAHTPAPRVALVTGAAQGIGRGIALQLVRDGYRVAASDLPQQSAKLKELEQCMRSNGAKDSFANGKGDNSSSMLVLTGDVSEEEDVKKMIEACIKAFGRLDVMVANAGIAVVKPLLETSPEEFDRVISINLRGTMLCYKYAAMQMIKQGAGGRIIGASSMNGKVGAVNLCSYSASKFGIRGLTHCAALEWGMHGITVNAYAPARILTPMLEMYDDQVTSQTDGMKKGDFLAKLASTTFGKLGGPEDVASLVSYLASPEAHFITGQTLSVNGGAYLD